MFKARKIQRRANELYSQMMEENTIITITGESYYDSIYRINFTVAGRSYQTKVWDESLPVKPGTIEHSNSINMASFAAFAIASCEYGRNAEEYIRACDKCLV